MLWNVKEGARERKFRAAIYNHFVQTILPANPFFIHNKIYMSLYGALYVPNQKDFVLNNKLHYQMIMDKVQFLSCNSV